MCRYLCINNNAALIPKLDDVIMSVDEAATMYSPNRSELDSENKHLQSCLFVTLRTDMTKHEFRLSTNLCHYVVISSSFLLQLNHSKHAGSWLWSASTCASTSRTLTEVDWTATGVIVNKHFLNVTSNSVLIIVQLVLRVHLHTIFKILREPWVDLHSCNTVCMH